MRNLPSPSRDLARQHLTSALKVRQRKGVQQDYAATEAEMDAVLALYDAYDVTRGEPADELKGLNLAAALRTAIHDSYDLTQNNGRLASIRASLTQGIERCPICGISAPRTLDHHLPKGPYKPLAIYVRNLIPICIECNQAKSVAASTVPAEQFIHAYLDLLPTDRFLRAQADIQNGGLVIEFSLDPAVVLPGLLAPRLDHQLRKLHLNERYAREINIYLGSQTTALHQCFDPGGAQQVHAYLSQQAAVETARFHANDWRALLLLALAEHADFCNGGFGQVLPMAPLPPAEGGPAS